ncbi:hypothetical protein MAR_015790, partial [Mya arenaria]
NLQGVSAFKHTTTTMYLKQDSPETEDSPSMVVSAALPPTVDVLTMQRITVVPTGRGVSCRPPRPPCWRDFMPSGSASECEFTDIGKVTRSAPESLSSNYQITSKTNKPKRVRAKLHRTHSQFAIDECDLPADDLTVTLADTTPVDIGLVRESSFNEQIEQEDNNRKCQSWLNNIEASQPLEDVSCYKLCDHEGEAISIEVPDDTNTYFHEHSDEQSTSSGSNKHITVPNNKTNNETYSYERLNENVTWMHSNDVRVKHTSSFKGEEIINTG